MRHTVIPTLLVAIVCSALRAWSACSPIEGAYGYAYSGLLQSGNGQNFQPTATSGRIVFRRADDNLFSGTLTGKQSDNSGGTVFTRELTGAYQIDKTTCTGTMTRQFLSNGVVVFEVQEAFTVVSAGAELKFIRTSPASFIVQGSMTKQ